MRVLMLKLLLRGSFPLALLLLLPGCGGRDRTATPAGDGQGFLRGDVARIEGEPPAVVPPKS